MTEISLVVGGVVALILVGVGTAFVPGIAPGGDAGVGTESSATEATVGETTGSGMADGETTDEQTTADTQPFVISIDNIEECGRTCRDVTSTLTNQQATTAEDVTVSTNLYAGTDTGGDTLWQRADTIGTLGDGESYTATIRIDLGYSDAYAVKQADGWILIQTTVETATRTVTFTEKRQVA